MLIYFARTIDNECSEKTYREWLEIAAADTVKRHAVTTNMHEADCVLIVDVIAHSDALTWKLRTHSIWKQGLRNILVYDERDWPRDPLAGLIVSLPHKFHQRSLHQPSPYFRTIQTFEEPLTKDPDLLYSFIGAASHKTRERVFALSHPRGISMQSGVNFFDEMPTSAVQNMQEDKKRLYRELMERSKFVLCPRGQGLSSFRLYEVMAAGRVPVIIADDWMPPAQVCWDDFALRVRESEIESIPALLEKHEPEFEQRSALARAAFDEHYATTKIFNYMAELCSTLLPVKKKSFFYRFPPLFAARAVRHKVLRRS